MEHGTLAVLRNNTSNHGSPGLTGHVLEKKLKEWIAAYRDDMDLQEILDWLQTEYKCCGVQGKNSSLFQGFKTLRLTAARRQPDATFQNSASDARQMLARSM